MFRKPQFIVVAHAYHEHPWNGAYTSSYRASVVRTTMTYAFACAVASMNDDAWGDVSYHIKALTPEAQAFLDARNAARRIDLDDEIPF